MHSDAPYPELELSDVTAVVRRALRQPLAEVRDLAIERIGGGTETTTSIFTVRGSAVTDTGEAAWSVVLKCVHPSQEPEHMADWNYRRREPLAYASGTLQQLPRGLSAPQCYGVENQLDGSIWLWLENLSRPNAVPWISDIYGAVAHQLGCFNGAYLTGHPSPTGEWVSRGWLRNYVARYAPVMQQLPKTPQTHIVRRAVPPLYLEEVLRLCAESALWLDTLDQLPQTFCHLDAWQPNLFLNPIENGEVQVTAVDWAFSGMAAAGQELTPLLLSAHYETGLEAHILNQYLQGLAAVGWQGDADTVQLGYVLSFPLTYAVAGLGYFVEALLDETQHPALEVAFGEPLYTIVDSFTGWLDYSLAFARRAREML